MGYMLAELGLTTLAGSKRDKGDELPHNTPRLCRISLPVSYLWFGKIISHFMHSNALLVLLQLIVANIYLVRTWQALSSSCIQ